MMDLKERGFAFRRTRTPRRYIYLTTMEDGSIVSSITTTPTVNPLVTLIKISTFMTCTEVASQGDTREARRLKKGSETSRSFWTPSTTRSAKSSVNLSAYKVVEISNLPKSTNPSQIVQYIIERCDIRQEQIEESKKVQKDASKGYVVVTGVDAAQKLLILEGRKFRIREKVCFRHELRTEAT